MIPNILVCGKTGAGKTSLIQAVSKAGLVPDSAVGHGQPTTRGFVLYHTNEVNFIDAEGMEGGKQTKQQYLDFLNSEISSRLRSSQVKQMVHVNWYCIDGTGGRVQNVDQQLINELGESTLVVITKSDGIRANQREPLLNAILPCVGNDLNRIKWVSNHEKHQHELLLLMEQTKVLAARQIQLSQQIVAFEKGWDLYFQEKMGKWQAEQSMLSAEADQIILWGAGRAAAIAFVPIPMVDVGPLMANEAYMISRLATNYGYEFDQTLVTAFIGMLGGSFAGKMFASWLPGAKIPIAYGVTYAIGTAAKLYFASGMTISKEELRRTYSENKNKKQE